jgi:hypothetical protein
MAGRRKGYETEIIAFMEIGGWNWRSGNDFDPGGSDWPGNYFQESADNAG